MKSSDGISPPSPLAGYLAVTLAAASWGSSGIFIKLIMRGCGISATALAFWRDITTFLVFLLICGIRRRDRMRIPRADWPLLAGMGVSLGLFHVSWNLGVNLNGAAITTIQQAAMPAIVLIAARILWGETLSWRRIVSLILIFVGTVLSSGILSAADVAVDLTGVMTGFMVPILYAGWNLFGKKVRARHPADVVLAYAFGIAALILLPFQFTTPQPWPVPVEIWLWFAGLIGVATAGAFFLYTFGLGGLPASVASILVMTEILFVTLYAYLFLGETMQPVEIAGGALIVTGALLLFQRSQSPAEAAPDPPPAGIAPLTETNGETTP